MNRIKALGQAGQSIWLDFMQRSLVTKGELQKLIDNDGIRGLTSNPTIFQKAVEAQPRLRRAVRARWRRRGKTVAQVYDALTLRDIQDAARIFRPVWEATAHRDGYCSLEVSPKLAHDTKGSIEEARRLWKALGAPNVMIKIPGTLGGRAGHRAMHQRGHQHQRHAALQSGGLPSAWPRRTCEDSNDASKEGQDVSGLASVASFFVSRIDSEVEKRIGQARAKGVDERRSRLFDGAAGQGGHRQRQARLPECTRGCSAARRWEALAKKGAHTQRVLWASTGTKNPKYSDVLYVEELMGPGHGQHRSACHPGCLS